MICYKIQVALKGCACMETDIHKILTKNIFPSRNGRCIANWGSPLSYKCKAERLSQVMIDETTWNRLFWLFFMKHLVQPIWKSLFSFVLLSLPSVSVQNFSATFSLITVEWHCTKSIQIFYCDEKFVLGVQKKWENASTHFCNSYQFPLW